MNNVTQIYGLRPDGLAALKAASAIVAANLARIDPEDALRAMRWHLAAAAQEPTWERGEAQVAIAANKLAVALRVQS